LDRILPGTSRCRRLDLALPGLATIQADFHAHVGIRDATGTTIYDWRSITGDKVTGCAGIVIDAGDVGGFRGRRSIHFSRVLSIDKTLSITGRNRHSAFW